MSDLKIAIMGASGRMGQALIRATHETNGCVVAGGTERSGSPAVGKDIGSICGLEELGVKITDDPLPLFTHVEAILDFTSPESTVQFAKYAAQARIIHVIGTTGFTPEQEAKIEAASRHARIIKAGNMSLGVNLLTALTRKVAEALDADFDIEILEMHHKHKVDAPSGTALMLGEAAAQGRKTNLEKRSVRVRDGITGPRNRSDIGFATLRGGSVIGDHTVIFAGEGERIELSHKAQDRSVFARGAVKAALWGKYQNPGLYDMCDVLGI